MTLRGIKSSRFWSCAIALLVAVQLALALHSFNHDFNSDAVTRGDECAVCHVASNMAPAPADAVIAPVSYIIAAVIADVLPAPVPAAPPAGFRSRAPPISLV